MLAKDLAKEVLRKHFREHPVATMANLFTRLQTRSRMSCFRRLREIGYYSSYSHAGKYYTLTTIPQFNAQGLWHFEGIGFSSSGNLKNTIATLVEKSSYGLTSGRLEKLLKVRVQNTLLDLARHQRIRRERVRGAYLYLSADKDKAKEQLACFQKQRLVPAPDRLPEWVLVEVLAAVIRCGDFLPEPGKVFKQLQIRGHSISLEEIEQAFEECNLKKND